MTKLNGSRWRWSLGWARQHWVLRMGRPSGDIQRDGEMMVAGSDTALARLMERRAAWGLAGPDDVRVFAGRDVVRAYKARLRALLTTH